MSYFVTAIGTDSGKTLISAILTEAFEMDYWKPIQAGTPGDSETVRSLISNPVTTIFQERYFLKIPASPHAAARSEGLTLNLDDFSLPESNNLIVEGAGGLLVPLNDNDTMLDLIKTLNIPLILVCNLYLGSINHSLLTCEVLKMNDIKVRGIIFNGIPNEESERVIESKSGYEVLFRLPQMENINKDLVSDIASDLRKKITL